MTTNNTTSPGTLYNIAPEGKAQLYTAAEIRAAAADGLQIWLDVGRRWPRVPCRMAATVRGWVTAAGEHGAIYQAWAGDFHGSPSPAEIVTAWPRTDNRRSPNQHRQDGTKTAPAVLILCPCRFLTMPPEI